MDTGISFNELLAWIGSETTRYEQWFVTQPSEVWAVPAGSGRIATVRDLLHHVYAVDVRLSQRVYGQALATDAEVAAVDPTALFALARRGQGMLATAVDGSLDLAVMLEWVLATGAPMRASRRKVVAHALTHHVRHLAQVATLLRQAGFATTWPHDLLLSDALA